MTNAARLALRLLAALCLLGGGVSALAVPRALLVGVSELVHQPQALWLQAPRNDVRLMRDALLGQGFAPADILVAADGVPGAVLPESAQIHAALQRLLASSRSGDFVFLYFSGHGTRLRDTRKRYQEPDGLAENFLAREVRGAIGSSPTLEGGLRDVDVDAWVQAFLAKKVFVAAIFDTCAAASMTRSAPGADPSLAQGPADDEVRWRGLRAAQLSGAPLARAALPVQAAPASPALPRARYVALFASESHQVTPELRLPRGSRRAQPQGLLTWAVVQSLARKPATWRELFDGALALYPSVIEELAQRFPERELPSPVAEGNLEAPLFANSAAVASTQPAWRARRAGGELLLAAGQLDGLVARQALRVAAQTDEGLMRSALAQAPDSPGLDSTRLPVPAALRDMPAQAQWQVTPLEPPAALALRVRSARALPAGMALDYPASLQRVGEGEAFDVRIDEGPTARLWVDARLLGQGEGLQAVNLAEGAALRERLATLARLKWLGALHAMAQGRSIEGFDAWLEAWAGDRLLRESPLDSVQQPSAGGAPVLPLAAGERAVLRVRNASAQSLHLVAVGSDETGRLHAVYPADLGESNRFERGTRDAPAAKRFELPWWQGRARLLVLALPAPPLQGPRLFGASPTQALAELRVRGQVLPDPTRAVYAAWVPVHKN